MKGRAVEEKKSATAERGGSDTWVLRGKRGALPPKHPQKEGPIGQRERNSANRVSKKKGERVRCRKGWREKSWDAPSTLHSAIRKKGKGSKGFAGRRKSRSVEVQVGERKKGVGRQPLKNGVTLSVQTTRKGRKSGIRGEREKQRKLPAGPARLKQRKRVGNRRG